jgi:hypothetical protein
VRRFLLAPCLTLVCAGTICAGTPAKAAALGGSGGLCPKWDYTQTWEGTPQYPNLLTGYTARSPCPVAGVDFRPGLPPSLVAGLLDPALSLPTSQPANGGFSYNAAQHSVRCDIGNGSSSHDLTFSGYDMSLNGGLVFNDVSCLRTTVTHNNFKTGANCAGAVSEASGATDIYIKENDIDGGGGSGLTESCLASGSEMITLSGASGDKVILDNHVINPGQHFVTIQGATGKYDIRRNLFERCGFYQGAHCNGIQFVGGVFYNGILAYNTWYSGQPDTSTALNITGTFLAASKTITAVSGLVTVSGTNATSLDAGMTVSSSNLPVGTKVVSVTQSGGPIPTAVNVTITVDQFPLADGSFSIVIPNAYPFGLVIPIRYTAQGSGTLTGGQVFRNTVISLGPIKGSSYSVYCNSASATVDTNVDTYLWGNYFDNTGVVGSTYYPTTKCTGGLFGSPYPNVDMVTGASITGP